MKLISRLRDHRFCAYCKAPRRVYVKKHVDMTNVIGMLAFAMAITYFAWGAPDPRGLVLFCVFISFSEVFVYLRWRTSLACGLCGFDPIVYKRSPQEASKRVQEFFAEHRDDPQFLLSRSPLVQVQKKLMAQERQNDLRREIRNQAEKRATRTSKPAASSLAPGKSL